MKPVLASLLIVVLLAGPACAINEKVRGGGKIRGGGKVGKFYGAAPTPTPTPTPAASTPTPTATPTPGGSAVQPVYPEQQMTYLGACKPATGVHGTQSFQFAGGNIGYDAGDGNIYIMSILGTSDVAEISPCTPTINSDFTALNAFTVDQGFGDISGGRTDGSLTGTTQADILPFGGVLWGMLYDAYGQSAAGTGIFQSSLTIATGFQNGVWDLDATANNGLWSKWIGAFPSGVPARFGNRELFVGDQKNANNQAWGPSLYAVDDPGTPPADGTDLSSVELLRYTSTNKMDGFNRAMGFHDAVWLQCGEYEAYVVSGRDAAQEYYGIPGHHGCGGQGYHGEPNNGVLWFFDPNDIKAVFDGTLQPHEPQPYRRWLPEDRLYHGSSGAREGYCVTGYHAYTSGMAYDEANRTLYVTELNITPSNPLAGPILHAWQCETTQTGTRDAAGPSAVSALSATPTSQQCALSWTAATDDVAVAFYRILRNKLDDPATSARWNETTDNRYIGLSETTSFTDDTDLTNGVQYTYNVEAVDSVGNVGTRVSTTCTPN